MVTSGQRIEIPLSRKKMLLMLFGSLIFVAIGFWFAISPPAISNSYWGNATKLTIVGYASMVFFGLCAIYLIRKLPDGKPGLIIDQTGLKDNSSAVSAGQILWSDIEGLSVIEIHRQKFIMVHVVNPQEYIDKQTRGFKRKMMQMNHKMYGTPLSINSNGLKISFEELLSILKDKLEETQKWRKEVRSHNISFGEMAGLEHNLNFTSLFTSLRCELLKTRRTASFYLTLFGAAVGTSIFLKIFKDRRGAYGFSQNTSATKGLCSCIAWGWQERLPKMGEASYFLGLFVDENHLLQKINAQLSAKDECFCTCCTHTLNGKLFGSE